MPLASRPQFRGGATAFPAPATRRPPRAVYRTHTRRTSPRPWPRHIQQPSANQIRDAAPPRSAVPATPSQSIHSASQTDYFEYQPKAIETGGERDDPGDAPKAEQRDAPDPRWRRVTRRNPKTSAS